MSEPKNNVSRVDHQPLVVPLDLWLQWHGDGTPEDDGEVCESEVTWSRDKIFDHDVEYVHADEIRRALMGHRRSELWGDKGLIAATMRCVAATNRAEEWRDLNDAGLRLRCGELTSQEIRAIRAVLAAILAPTNDQAKP